MQFQMDNFIMTFKVDWFKDPLLFIETSIWWTSFMVFSQRCNLYSPVFGNNRVFEFEYVSEIDMKLLKHDWKRFECIKSNTYYCQGSCIYFIHENNMMIFFCNIWNLGLTKLLNHLYRNILKKETPCLIGCKFIFVSILY